MYQYDRKGKDAGINKRSNAAQLAKKGADSKWEGIMQLAGKKRRLVTKNEDNSDDESDEDVFYTQENEFESSLKKQKTRGDESGSDVELEDEFEADNEFEEEDEDELENESGSENELDSTPKYKSKYVYDSDSEEESSSTKKEDPNDDEYLEPVTNKIPRWAFNREKLENVIKSTAHERKNIDTEKFEAVYTCPNPTCRRPIAYIEKDSDELKLVDFSYITKKKKNHKTQRSAVLDHFPRWADRYKELSSQDADEVAIRKNHDDESMLRALCKKCNEKHDLENKKTIDYESDIDESGYVTDDVNEPLNKDRHKPFRYYKDDKDGKGGGGTTA